MIPAQQFSSRKACALTWMGVFLLLVGLPLFAQTAPNSDFDSLWQRAILYHDDHNPILQEFKLRGRYHGQYHGVDSNVGDDDGWEDRRSRFGFDAKLFEKKLELRLDFQSNDGFRDFYDGLVDAFIRWRPISSLNVTMGKIQPLIAYGEWMTPYLDNETVERSEMFNQMRINRATGLTVDGLTNGFLWQLGVYANDTPFTTRGSGRWGDGEWGDGEWGDLAGGVSFSAGIGHDFKDRLHVDKAMFRLDWMHSDREPDDLVLARYDDIVTATMQWKEGPWAISGDLYHASGGDDLNEDLYGIYILPTYDIIPEKLQLVGHLSYSKGEGPASILAQARYEAETPIAPIPGIPGSDGRGDEYRAIYLGAQYFIHGNKLKFMGGVEYSELLREGDSTAYNGVTMISAVRFYF